MCISPAAVFRRTTLVSDLEIPASPDTATNTLCVAAYGHVVRAYRSGTQSPQDMHIAVDLCAPYAVCDNGIEMVQAIPAVRCCFGSYVRIIRTERRPMADSALAGCVYVHATVCFSGTYDPCGSHMQESECDGDCMLRALGLLDIHVSEHCEQATAAWDSRAGNAHFGINTLASYAAEDALFALDSHVCTVHCKHAETPDVSIILDSSASIELYAARGADHPDISEITLGDSHHGATLPVGDSLTISSGTLDSIILEQHGYDGADDYMQVVLGIFTAVARELATIECAK